MRRERSRFVGPVSFLPGPTLPGRGNFTAIIGCGSEHRQTTQTVALPNIDQDEVVAKILGLPKRRSENMTRISLDATLVVSQTTEPLQGAANTNSLYVLIASLVLAFIAMIILLRVRW